MPKIDTSKIVGYADMTAEQKLAALEAYEYEENHDGYVKKDLLDKATSDAAKYKKQLQDKMTEDEKKEAQAKEKQEAMEQELATLRREKVVATHKASLIALGYDEALAEDTANAMADNDNAKILANQKVYQEALTNKIRAELVDGTPTPPPGDGNNEITKEQFKKMGMDERTELYNKNPELFKKLSS